MRFHLPAGRVTLPGPAASHPENRGRSQIGALVNCLNALRSAAEASKR